MGARGRRDELVALIVLVVLAVAITGILAIVQPSSLPHTDDEPDPSTTAEPQEAPEETGVRLWGEPFVYACRVLPSADVERIFGESGSQGYVRQQYLDRMPTTTELDGATAFSYGGLGTRCTHWFDDAAGHELDVMVTQYPSASLAQRRLSTLTHARGQGRRTQPPAARPVAGSGGRVFYLAGSRSFLISSDDLSVEVRYSTTSSDKSARPMSSGDVARQAVQMQDVVTMVDRHRVDGSAVLGPVPTTDTVSGTVGGTPYVEPCAVLDTGAFEALGGPPAEPVVVDTTVIRHDPYTNAAVSSCERSGTLRDGGPRRVRSTFAVLEVRVAPDPASAEKVREQHLADRYPRGTRIRELTTGAGTAYVVDVGGTKRDPLRTRVAHLVVGAYELRLAAVLEVGPRLKSGRPPTDEQLIASLDALAEAMSSAATDVP